MNLRTKIFKDLIEEQLASIPDITFRRLFSGFGIYSGETIFGLIHGERLYFHTDDEKSGTIPEMRIDVLYGAWKQKAPQKLL